MKKVSSPRILALLMLLPHLVQIHGAKSDFIIDGEIVKPDEERSVFAFVQFKTKPEFPHDYGMYKSHICTAFPISPTLFLTAAHCMVKPEFYQLTLTNAVNAMKPDLADNLVHPLRMQAHPTFNDPEFEGSETDRTRYDIAFIKIADPLFSVKPLLLPDLNETASKKSTSYPLKTNETVKLVGYGFSSWDVDPVWGESVAVKRKSLMNVSEVLDYYFFIPGMKKNVAPGDSGGPVIVETPKGDTVVGIVSGMSEPDGENPRGIFNRLTRENLCWVQTASEENLGLDCNP